jgi:hypothetical protein
LQLGVGQLARSRSGVVRQVRDHSGAGDRHKADTQLPACSGYFRFRK